MSASVNDLLDGLERCLAGKPDAMANAVRDFIACHDSGSYESEGQALDTLRALTAALGGVG